jgi:DMSO reductase family type II enzyme iron-sulfur subunit
MSKHQVAMVMDLNKCLGCHTCSIACKRLWTRREGMDAMWWNSVNTMPGQGTPRNWEGMGGGFDSSGQPIPGHLPTYAEFGEAWEFEHEKVFFGGNPDATLLPLGDDPSWGPNWDEDVGAGEYPNSYYFYLPRICNHCTHPACMEACPRKAIIKRDEDGIVILNEDHCRGFRFCQEACPYKKIYFNTASRVSQKCIFCLPRIEKGVATACSRQCPGRVRFVGYLDDPEGPIHQLVYKYGVALPLHAEFGTEPNVFYVPPLSPPKFDENGIEVPGQRIPIEYLESIFGPKVKIALSTIEREMQRKRSGGTSDLMDLLISRRWLDMFKPFDKHPKDSTDVQPVKFFARGERK